MEILFLVLGFILILVGIIGSFLPVLPGVPVSWLGLVALYLTPAITFDWTFIIITGIVAIVLYILDYIIPAIGTKKYGGSKAGVYGTMVGLIVGIIVPIPLGILWGPFLGAFIGETAFNNSTGDTALKAAFGSFIGFLASTFVKFMATLIYLGLFIYKVIEYREVLF
ncbi:DUF456 domain-containing protein [Patiriisocius marinus]|uniref:DUF456 domain-containing protein n=1 Tax=Patiriisocius marinus TaxID=1397112 RepID=UPI00232D476F|nr:DUF456 domain-containing protein [Patiriisocius marinus]